MGVLFHQLLFALLICVTATSSSFSAERPPRSRTKPKAKRAEVNKLLKRYRHAGLRVDQRQQIVDEAVALGSPCIVALRTMIGQQSATSLQKYRGEFFVRVGNAANLTPAGVILGSKQLAAFRQELMRSSEFARQLEKAASVAVPVEGDESSGDAQQAETVFEQRLRRIESDLILKWLVDKGLGQLSSGEAALVVEVNPGAAHRKS